MKMVRSEQRRDSRLATLPGEQSAGPQREGMILDNQWTAKVIIYPLLCSSFGQCVAITQIVDFNVLDVVTILLVYVAAVELASRVGRGRLGDCWRSGHSANRGHVDMLNALLRGYLRVDPRSRRRRRRCLGLDCRRRGAL